jgi:hypothetical protein
MFRFQNHLIPPLPLAEAPRGRPGQPFVWRPSPFHVHTPQVKALSPRVAGEVLAQPELAGCTFRVRLQLAPSTRTAKQAARSAAALLRQGCDRPPATRQLCCASTQLTLCLHLPLGTHTWLCHPRQPITDMVC